MHDTSFDGIWSEWKLLSRHVALVGVTFCGEVGLGPVETELEAKLILDKEGDPVVLAHNPVGRRGGPQSHRDPGQRGLRTLGVLRRATGADLTTRLIQVIN